MPQDNQLADDQRLAEMIRRADLLLVAFRYRAPRVARQVWIDKGDGAVRIPCVDGMMLAEWTGTTYRWGEGPDGPWETLSAKYFLAADEMAQALGVDSAPEWRYLLKALVGAFQRPTWQRPKRTT